MQGMQYQGGYSGMPQHQSANFHMNQMNHINSMSRMSGMMPAGGGMAPRMNMMGMSSANSMAGMSGMNNLPIRAGGPSINMRMPIDPHARMYSGQGRPSPYPNPAMYMAQKRHQSPIYNGQMQSVGPLGPGGQFMTRGPYPGGYPMGHPHNMGGGPGPGFSGMPPGMRHSNMMPNNMPMTSMSQNYPVNSSQMGPMNSIRPAGPGSGGGGYQPSMGPGNVGPNGMFPVRPKTEIPTVSPRGAATLSTFQHSPVPGNPTPPLTPNGPGNCISAPFASPQSDHGSSTTESKPNFSLASKYF